MVVVQDGGDFVVTWMPKGTKWMVAVTPSTRTKSDDRGERIGDLMLRKDWEFGEREWVISTLWLMKKQWPFALWVSWLETGERFGGWYVNIQEPFQRKQHRLVSMDLALDVVIAADRTWRWKDEDELETLQRLGAIDSEKAGTIRASGEQAIAMMEANVPPFSEPWHEWQPDPRWQTPVLPDGWDSIE